ncbi:MAG: hypothetical protein O7F73_16695 [Gammaproteobacteria bacterium]|nr:hypothetical protein [Gammaproteobacteria bacterium]
MPSLVIAGLAFGLSQVALSLLLLWHRPHWRLTERLYVLLLPMLGQLLQPEGMLRWLLFSLPQLLEFLLLGLTLWVVARHWRVDLVASRRRLRWWFVAVNGVYIFALILLRELLFAHERPPRASYFGSVIPE